MVHGGFYNVGKIFVEINNTIQKFIKSGFKIDVGDMRCLEIITVLERLKSTISIKIVVYNPPKIDGLKCNINWILIENPNPSATAFCIRKGSLFGF